jgi:hypothetical protein
MVRGSKPVVAYSVFKQRPGVETATLPGTEATLAALVRSYDHVPIAMSNGKNGILLFFSK